MKNFNRFFILFLSCCCLAAAPAALAQQSKSGGGSAKATSDSSSPGVVSTNSSGYTLGPGDEVEIKVLGETQFDGVYSVDEDGMILPAFAEKPIKAACRTERDVRADVTKVYAKYLKNPQINFRVTEKNSRAKAVIYGEVRAGSMQVEMLRRVRLLELISFAGGVDMEKAGGSVQLAHTQPLQCPQPGDEPDTTDFDKENIGFKTYKLSDVMAGKKEANPLIRPGDLIIVNKAEPVYIIGEVRRGDVELRIPESGLTLTDAVARVGGVSPQAKKKDVRIYRLKPGSTEREMLTFNLVAIKDRKQENPLLKPYDVIEVEKAPKSPTQFITEILTGTVGDVARTASTGVIR